MPRYRFEIDDTNTVKIWDEKNPNELNAPFILQPDHPDARPWVDRKEAESWANAFVSSLYSSETQE